MYDADDGGDDARTPQERSSGSGAPQLGFVRQRDFDDFQQVSDRALRSTRKWLGWMTTLLVVLIIGIAFSVRIAVYQARKIDKLTLKVNAQSAVLAAKVDRATVATMIAVELDTVMVTAVRAEKLAASVRADIATINNDLADAAAAIDDIGNEALKRFNGQVYAMKQAQDLFQSELRDSISSFRNWAQGLADQSELRWSKEAVDRNSGDLEIKIRLDRLERWRSVNTGLNLVNLAGFIRHVSGDAHHGK